MKKVLAVSIASIIMASISAYADENIAQERFRQKATNFGGTAQSVQSATNKPTSIYSQTARQRYGYGAIQSNNQQYNFARHYNSATNSYTAR